MSNLIWSGGEFSKNQAFVWDHLEKPDAHISVYGCLKKIISFAKEMDVVQLAGDNKSKINQS